MDASARQLRQQHPAVGLSRQLDRDIYKSLFDWVFVEESFVHWQSSPERWQLRYSGSPGSGKTTLSALAVDKLRETYCGEKDAVAAIFIREDVLPGDAAFLDAFLVSVLQQLCGPRDPKPGSIAIDPANEVDSVSTREAIQTRLSSLRNAFLVVDDIDRVELPLEDELARLKLMGLRVMTTSRIPIIGESIVRYSCDGSDCPERQERRVFWECQVCKTEDSCFNLCRVCKVKGESCTNCKERSDLIQPYDHVNLPINMADGEAMEAFISWSLEAEHGDLGLDTPNPDKPRPSRPSTSSPSVSTRRAAAADLVQELARRAGYNIALARLRLDLAHSGVIGPGSAAAARWSASDRLPGPVVALFDAGLARIEAQPTPRRELGLCAIAAVAIFEGRVRAADLVRWAHAGSRNSPGTGLADVLRAARGFLVAAVSPWEDEWHVDAYHADFLIYASEGYRESLAWAAASLGAAREESTGRTWRSMTFQIGGPALAAIPRRGTSGLRSVTQNDLGKDVPRGQAGFAGGQELCFARRAPTQR